VLEDLLYIHGVSESELISTRLQTSPIALISVEGVFVNQDVMTRYMMKHSLRN